MSSTQHIPYELVVKIEGAIKQRKLLEKLANSYSYQEQLNFQSNLGILAKLLVQKLEIPMLWGESLKRFMVDKNLPIQFTLRPLRVTHLVDFLGEWLNHSSLDSSYHRNALRVCYRNSLFKTILNEEKQTIDDYFSTLSKKNMLISDDLFNLLQNILSPYFLYEYQCDKQPFFLKENAIESFKQLINKYVVSKHRVLFNSQLQTNQYIRRGELQNLIQFWEAVNQQLELCLHARRTVSEDGIQTDLNHTRDLQVQTQHQNVTILNLINSTLIKLNSSTQQGKHSEAIQRICAFLRAEKISLLRIKEKQHGQYPSPPKTQKYKLTTSKFFQDTPKPLSLSISATPKVTCSKIWQKCNETDKKQSTILEKSSQRNISSAFYSFKATV